MTILDILSLPVGTLVSIGVGALCFVVSMIAIVKYDPKEQLNITH